MLKHEVLREAAESERNRRKPSFDRGGFQDYSLQPFHQRWKVFPQERPKDVEIDFVISVNQAVPQRRNFSPWDLGVAEAEFLRDAHASFPDHLHEADQGEIQHPNPYPNPSVRGLGPSQGPLWRGSAFAGR